MKYHRVLCYNMRVTSPAAQNIGRTLARLATLAPRRHSDHPVTPADSRQQILAFIRRADEPIGVDQLCAETGLHANTVRGHLEVLLAAGEVHRHPAAKKGGRGRPPWLYSAGPGQESAYTELTHTLIQELGVDADAQLITEAATRWAGVVDRRAPAESPDEAVQQAADALSRLGFDATVSPIGDEIVLNTCPYISLVEDQPVICDIHAAMLDELLKRSEQDVSVSELQVFPRTGMCRARLSRPDLEPVRAIVRHDHQEQNTSRRKKAT